MEQYDNTFLANILSGGSTIGQPIFTKKKAGLILKDGKIAVDPNTNEIILKKDRINYKKFLKNPRRISATNSLDFNLPNLFGVNPSGAGSDLASILSSVKEIK